MRLDKLALETPHGRLEVFGARRGRIEPTIRPVTEPTTEVTSEPVIDAILELVLRDHERGGSGIERIAFAGTAAWFKRSAVRGRTRLRWGCKRAVGARLPRVREHENLEWLGRNGFQAPVPLVSGVLVRHGSPVRQFLVTRDVPAAITLEDFLRDAARSGSRAEVLGELAREVARLHVKGFLHHDLYPRNVLVMPVGSARRIVFLDAWAGGPPPQLRPCEYDLACLFLRADRELAAAEVQAFLAAYASERAARGSAVDARRILARTKRLRARLVKRLLVRQHELRGEAAPALEW